MKPPFGTVDLAPVDVDGGVLARALLWPCAFGEGRSEST
jgi:hypothetical protein